jgi:carbonic anhydrase
VTDERLSPAQAWARLEAGNRHWAEGHLTHPDQDPGRRIQVARRQDPFATIVSCIDSRVPPETVFDEGIGDLFVVRTGAHTIDGLVTASIEYGPLENGTPLIVVLGHERCGAVTAATRALQTGTSLPGHLDAIVLRLSPAYDDVTGAAAGQAASATGTSTAGTGAAEPDAALIDKVVRAQIRRTVNELGYDTALAGLVERGRLGIAGAYYDLDTGVVTRLHTLGF